MVLELNQLELKEINGGHNGDAYHAGVEVGTAIRKIGTVLGVVGFLLAL